MAKFFSRHIVIKLKDDDFDNKLNLLSQDVSLVLFYTDDSDLRIEIWKELAKDHGECHLGMYKISNSHPLMQKHKISPILYYQDKKIKDVYLYDLNYTTIMKFLLNTK